MARQDLTEKLADVEREKMLELEIHLSSDRQHADVADRSIDLLFL